MPNLARQLAGAEPTFVCAECGATRAQPAASADDYDLQGDHYVACGRPVCGPCSRRGMEPWMARHFTDGDDVRCECCGQYDCACRAVEVDASSPREGLCDVVAVVCAVHGKGMD